MSPTLEATHSETHARDHRVAVLLAAVTPHLPAGSGAANAQELCSAFDQAVEFAAFEGKSVGTAVAEFLADDWGPAQPALRKLVTPEAPFVPKNLPILPRAAAKLLRTNEESATVAELNEIAGSDPALAAQLLRVANSARFGSRCEITRLRDAVMRIGIPAARQVLLAASFSGLFTSEGLRQIWEHSQRVAANAQELARLCATDPESAYVAGLLHDIGRVAFTVFPGPMQTAERRWLDAGFPLIYSETMAYGSDHAAFGAELLRSWQIPDVIVEAVGHHHRPECSRSNLHAAVHLAEAAGEDLWSNMRKRGALELTRIAPEQLEKVLASSSVPALGTATSEIC